MWLIALAMASHFSMIGFDLDMSSADAMETDLQRFAERCKPAPLDGQSQICVLRDQSGAELWIGMAQLPDGELEIRTVNPALTGEGNTRIVVTGDVTPSEWRPFEPRVAATFPDEVPLILDLADPLEAAKFTSGAQLDLDITAFADEIAIHASEEEYYASQGSNEVKFASNYFIPSGMFTGEKGASDGPTAHALLAGEIVKAELRRNQVGNASYWWILTRTYGGAVVNVVADPSTISAPPRVGGIVSGRFWLSARTRRP